LLNVRGGFGENGYVSGDLDSHCRNGGDDFLQTHPQGLHFLRAFGMVRKKKLTQEEWDGVFEAFYALPDEMVEKATRILLRFFFTVELTPNLSAFTGNEKKEILNFLNSFYKSYDRVAKKRDQK